MFARTQRIFTIVAFSLAAALVSAAPAGAETGATNRALQLWERIQPIDEAFDKTIESLRAFQAKSRYCKPSDPNDKSFDQAWLDSNHSQSEADYAELLQIRNQLQRLISNDGRARAVIEEKAGDVSPVDPRFWSSFASKVATIRSLKSQKQRDLDAAPEINCGGATGGSNGSFTTPTQPPADPLAGFDVTAPDYADVNMPSLPTGPICTQDEKSQIVDRVGVERQKARDNSLKAAYYVVDLGRILHPAQARGDTAVVKAIQPLYDKAVKDSAAREKTAAALDALWNQATALKVEDCVPSDLTPSGTLGGAQDGALGVDLPDVDLKSVELPTLPKSVCKDEDRNPFIVDASTALSHAMYNRSQWERRLDAIATAMRRGQGDAAKLQKARAAARTEAAKWRKIVDDAQDAFDAAQAIPIVDCDDDDDKIGYVDPSSNADMAAALAQAIASKPVRETSSGGYGGHFGGRFVRSDGVGDSLAQDAENAVDDALKDVETDRAFHDGRDGARTPAHPREASDDAAVDSDNDAGAFGRNDADGQDRVSGWTFRPFDIPEDCNAADGACEDAGDDRQPRSDEGGDPQISVLHVPTGLFADPHSVDGAASASDDVGERPRTKYYFSNDHWMLQDRYSLDLGFRFDDAPDGSEIGESDDDSDDPYAGRPGDGDRDPSDIYARRLKQLEQRRAAQDGDSGAALQAGEN